TTGPLRSSCCRLNENAFPANAPWVISEGTLAPSCRAAVAGAAAKIAAATASIRGRLVMARDMTLLPDRVHISAKQRLPRWWAARPQARPAGRSVQPAAFLDEIARLAVAGRRRRAACPLPGIAAAQLGQDHL